MILFLNMESLSFIECESFVNFEIDKSLYDFVANEDYKRFSRFDFPINSTNCENVSIKHDVRFIFDNGSHNFTT